MVCRGDFVQYDGLCPDDDRWCTEQIQHREDNCIPGPVGGANESPWKQCTHVDDVTAYDEDFYFSFSNQEVPNATANYRCNSRRLETVSGLVGGGIGRLYEEITACEDGGVVERI